LRTPCKADWALIYFAGHGIEIDRVNYLIPVDARLLDDRDVKAETVSYEELLQTIGGARALRLLVLDACRVNRFKDGMHRTIASRGGSDRGLAPPPEAEPGTLIVYSAKDGQVAADDASGRTATCPHLAQFGGSRTARLNLAFPDDVPDHAFNRRLRGPLVFHPAFDGDHKHRSATTDQAVAAEERSILLCLGGEQTAIGRDDLARLWPTLIDDTQNS
jgi:hypothetical protein